MLCCSSLHCDDCRHQGLPIIILGGPGEGESGVITEYYGRTRRAAVDFEHDVGYGSKYAIRHDKGLGIGYKVCEVRCFHGAFDNSWLAGVSFDNSWLGGVPLRQEKHALLKLSNS